MADQNQDPYANYYSDFSMRIRDIDEKQRIMKDRLLLIGKNLIETKERANQEITELKKQMTLIQTEMERIKDFLENISTQFSKFARKEDLEILAKQARMFQPSEE